MRGPSIPAATLLFVCACATPRQLDAVQAELDATKQTLAQVQAARETERDERAELERRLALLESWSEQSQAHTLGLTETLTRLSATIEGLRTRLGDVGPGEFEKGQRARPNMTPLELRQYATAQGDPHFGRFTLDEALAGDDRLSDRSRGKLVATFETSHGRFDCVLHEDGAPNTVANFVGLARGVRASLDPKTDTWTHRPLYDGTIFHRVIAGFMIQGGDPRGNGRGGPGYAMEDELDASQSHRPGTLSMANAGPNTAGSQFFINVVATPHLDGKHAIFGHCDPDTPIAISKVDVDVRAAHRPRDPVEIRRIRISRRRR
ncbi:MAG: peptidylprolyl isomerase [Myxococcota bacterium]